MTKSKALTVGLAVLGVAAFALPGMANPFKDVDGNIHIQNLSPGASAVIQSGELTRKVTANFCGLVTAAVPTGQTMPASIMVGTDTITVASLPIQSIPRCVNGALAEARTANFKDSTGRVVVVGKTAGTQYDVTYTGLPSTRSLTANQCGFVRIGNSTTKPAPTSFSYGGQNYTTGSLPTQSPGLCRSGVKYLPAP